MAPSQRAPRGAFSARTRFSVGAFVALTGAVWAIYGRALHAPFIFDDLESVAGNASIVHLWPLVTSGAQPGPLNRLHTNPVAGRPLVNLSLAVNYHFGRLDPAGYHAFNICLHILAALLAFAVLRRTLSLAFFAGRYDRANDVLSVSVALLWAVHPLVTETVAYVTQRTEQLMACCYLLTLYGALRYWTTSPPARTRWLVLATGACLAGMASKEMMVTAPVVVLLFERTFVTGSFRKAWQDSRPLYIGLAAGWLLLAYLNVGSPRGDAAGFHGTLPAYVWWITQAKTLFVYLKLVVWPQPLAIHYESTLLPSLGVAWPWVLAATACGVATLALLRRRSAVGMVGAWVLLILSPTLVVPMSNEVVAERRMYLPLVALCALIVVGGYGMMQRAVAAADDAADDAAERGLRGRRLMTTGAVALSALLVTACVRSCRRVGLYNDELALWRDTLASQPADALAHYNYGVALGDRGRMADAIGEFETAIRLEPDNASAHFDLALALGDANRTDDAIAHFEAALRLQPNRADDHIAYGAVLLHAGRDTDAIAQFERALELDPGNQAATAALADARSAELAKRVVTTTKPKPR